MTKDQELMARVRDGDPAAFEALVAAYWPVAERVARGIVGDAQLAQDVAQEVFADLYVQRGRYQPRYSVHAYVAAIARHKGIDLLRRRGKPAAALAADQAEPPGPRTPEDAFIARMFRGALYAAVEALPARQRRMLVAFALEGRSYREIAAELGISVAQVKVTLFRVRRRLRQIKEDFEHE